MGGGQSSWVTVKLGELVDKGIVELKRGRIIAKTALSDDYKYPVYSASVTNNGLMGYSDTYDFDEELISWSVDGGGDVFYRPKHKFSITNVSGYLRILDNSKLDYRYLAYVLQIEKSKHTFDYTNKAHPSVIRGLYNVTIIPIEEQRRIASLLSTFDSLSDKIGAEIVSISNQKQAIMAKIFG